MADHFSRVFEVINFNVFLFSALLFFIGYAIAPTAYYKQMRWLLAYPMLIAGWLDKLAKKRWKPVVLFTFLFGMNSFSLLIDLVSAVVPFLPYVFAVWTGLNIGVITYHTLEGHFYLTALLNPVALFELPAAFLTFTMAIQYNLTRMGITSLAGNSWHDLALDRYLVFFVFLVLPVLLMAGIIETFLIHVTRDMDQGDKDH